MKTFHTLVGESLKKRGDLMQARMDCAIRHVETGSSTAEALLLSAKTYNSTLEDAAQEYFFWKDQEFKFSQFIKELFK